MSSLGRVVLEHFQAHEIQPAQRIGSGVVLREDGLALAEERPQHHVFHHGHLLERARDLERPGDPGVADLVGGEMGDLLAEKLDLPGRGLVDPGDDVEEGRLPGAVGADEAAEFALLNFEADLLQGLKVAK